MLERIEVEQGELLRENAMLADRVKYLEEELEKQEIMNGEQVTEMLKIKPITLARWRANGLPFHKVGRTSPCYYIKSEIIEWIKKF